MDCVWVSTKGNGNLYDIDNDDVNQFILNFGFKPIRYDPFNRTPYHIDDYKSSSMGNTIYVRNIDFIKERCLNSKKVCIKTANNLSI